MAKPVPCQGNDVHSRSTLQSMRAATSVRRLPVAIIDEVRARLGRVSYPGFARSIVSLGLVEDVTVHDGGVTITLVVPSRKADVLEELQAQVRSTALRVAGVS